MNKNLLVSFALCAWSLTTACGSPFNIDHQLPGDDISVRSVLPEAVGDVQGEIDCNYVILQTYKGGLWHSYQAGERCTAVYGELGTIWAAKMESAADAGTFFDKEIFTLETADKMEAHGPEEGFADYTLRDTHDSGFMWRKATWVFDIKGGTSADRDTLVEAFEYISPL